MRKVTFAAQAAISAIMIASCGNQTPSASLKSDVDTMSYAIGMAQTQGLKEYLAGSLEVDTAFIEEFIKGVNTGVSAGENKKKAAYYAGIQIGRQISNRMMKSINQDVFGEDSTQSISQKNYMAGFISGLTGKNSLMTVDSAQTLSQQLIQAIKTKVSEKKSTSSQTSTSESK